MCTCFRVSNPSFPPTVLNGHCGFRNFIDLSAFCTFYLINIAKAFGQNGRFKRREGILIDSLSSHVILDILGTPVGYLPAPIYISILTDQNVMTQLLLVLCVSP